MTVVAWADRRGLRWAFTLSNAGANYFEDRCRIDQLGEINWDAVRAARIIQDALGIESDDVVVNSGARGTSASG